MIAHLGIDHTSLNIAPIHNFSDSCQVRNVAIKQVFPDYQDDLKSKIFLKGVAVDQIKYFMLMVQKPDVTVIEDRFAIREYLQIVTTTNYKQQVGKTAGYFHADRLNNAVLGTPNRLAYNQGFFVKNDDGSATLKPIAHLYKTQMYALARHLSLPNSTCDIEPTTDTYSMPQGLDEFYFYLLYKQIYLALWVYNHDYPLGDLADHLDSNPSRQLMRIKILEINEKQPLSA
jgi:NAD+ synthase